MPPMPLVRPPPSSKDLPSCDGEPMETARHAQQMWLLIESLEFAWADRTDFYVAGNLFLYYSETQSRRNDFKGPDVFVVLGTTRRERKSWVVWEEDGKAPDVIIELLSESTEHVDRNDKMRIYARTLKVGEYFLFDPWSSVLEGYTLDVRRGAYVRKAADENGRVFCDQLELWLGVRTSVLHGVEVPWLRWMDADGRVLPKPVELTSTEADRANAEAARAKRLEAELAALRAKVP